MASCRPRRPLRDRHQSTLGFGGRLDVSWRPIGGRIWTRRSPSTASSRTRRGLRMDLGESNTTSMSPKTPTKEATSTMHILALAPLAFLMWFSHPAVGNTKEFAQSYTSEEMHQMAALYKRIVEGKPLEHMDQYFMAFQFRGYVAAALDHLSIGAEQINECARKYSLNHIAARSAAFIESTPSDRAMVSAVEVHSAIIIACEAVKTQQ
jgi:hypothetical protein